MRRIDPINEHAEKPELTRLGPPIGWWLWKYG